MAGMEKDSLVTHMRRRWADWTVVVILTIIFPSIEYAISPFERFIPEEGPTHDSIQFPHKENNTVPSWTVPLLAIVPPLLVIAIYKCKSRDCELREFHDLILSVLLTITATATITSALKESIGRPRPDFLERCFPKGNAEYEDGGYPECTGDKEVIVEGRKSFPSGHSSWTMCSLAYTTFFLLGKLRAFNGQGHVWKVVVSILPLVVAVAVGISRINDYWHHWTDVVAGWAIGFLVALVVYCMHYPSPLSRIQSHVPLYKQREEMLPLSQVDGRTSEDAEGGRV